MRDRSALSSRFFIIYLWIFCFSDPIANKAIHCHIKCSIRGFKLASSINNKAQKRLALSAMRM